MGEKLNGRIIKSLGGFYYVETAEGIIETRARGIFRKNGEIPLVGDCVIVSVPENGLYTVNEILKRKNELVRPPLANLDRLFLIVSVMKPYTNLFILDKLIAIAEFKDIEPVVVVSKADLADTEQIRKTYVNAGFKTLVVSAFTGDGVDEVELLLKDGISAFAGNSGVGKSTLLNAIDEQFGIKTAEISDKLGRGRHTTRHVELFKLNSGGYVADTPGFTSLELEKYTVIMKDDLEHCFREFEPYIGMCKFTSCSHTGEKGCRISEAVRDGHIEATRYESYVTMYNEVKDIKEWERSKG